MAKKGKTKRLEAIFAEMGVNVTDEPPIPEVEKSYQPIRKNNECGKVCYSSQGSCEKAIRFRLNVGSDTSRLRSYYCQICKSWHMSKSYHRKK